jgi:small neutral amino acid transporter SnatA (MarC family)
LPKTAKTRDSSITVVFRAWPFALLTSIDPGHQDSFSMTGLSQSTNKVPMTDLLRSITLLFVMLNPFLVIVYLTDVMDKLERQAFTRVLFRGALIAGTVFCCFAVLGDAIFSDLLQTHFASFQIFGGVVFLLIGLQFVFRGLTAIEMLRGESEHLAGAIAMPVLVGPGTISVSVLIGERHEPVYACVAVMIAVLGSTMMMLALKWLHDFVKPRNAKLIDRYTEVAGRITALYVGTVAVEMIMKGIQGWTNLF